MPGDAAQSTKRQRQEEIPRDSQPACSPLVQPQTHRCKFLVHRYRNLHVNCHLLSEKRQRSETSEASGGKQGVDEWQGYTTETMSHPGQKIRKHYTLQNRKVVLNMHKFGVVEVVDRPQSQSSALDTLGAKTMAWTDRARCELWHEDLNKRSVLMQILMQERQGS